MKDKKKIKFSVLNEGSIYAHLALEDYLFEHNISSLLLYRNSPAVVIGKHQNPWLETDPVKYLFARRRSGGGAVYHDEGNLNYTVILPKELYDRTQIFQIIQTALMALDIETELNQDYSIFYKDKKISGSAFRQNSRTVLHHGTLLVDTDLSALITALQSPYYFNDLKSTKSNPSNVTNLNEINSSLTVYDVTKEILQAFDINFNLTEAANDKTFDADEEIRRLEQKYRSPEWLYGETLTYFQFLSINKNRDKTNGQYFNNKTIILEDANEKAGISQ